MDLDAAHTRVAESLTLFCAWPATGRRRPPSSHTQSSPEPAWEVAKINMSADVESHIREACERALEALGSRESITHTADAELHEDQVFLITEESEVGELAHLFELAQRSADLNAVPVADLPQKKIKLYGVAAGNGDERLAFVKKSNPVKVAARGKLWAIPGERRLNVLEPPLFEFSGSFDMVVDRDWAAVLNQQQFEILVRESPLMQAHIRAWVKTIADALPLAPESEAALQDAAARDSRLWRKLRAIRQKGLGDVTLDKVRTYAKAMDIDTTKLIVNGKIHFTADERFVILKLLNEDLYRGQLTGQAFEAQRKGALS